MVTASAPPQGHILPIAEVSSRDVLREDTNIFEGVSMVNGRDVSPQEAARALRTADEPLVVTLRRMKLGSPPAPAPVPAGSSPPSPSATAAPPPASATQSVEVQTEDLWPDWPSGLSGLDGVLDSVLDEESGGAPERSLHDILEQDIDLEEVTLLRSEAEEQLGITLSCSCSSGSDDLDTEVYIASVEPASLAGRDGRLQRGDQILQVNGEDITTRELAEHMFNSPGPAITLLVSRYYSEDDGDQDDEEGETCRRPACGKPAKPRTPTHAKHLQGHSDRDTAGWLSLSSAARKAAAARAAADQSYLSLSPPSPDDGSSDRRSDASSDRRSDGSTDRRSDARSDGSGSASGDRRSDGDGAAAAPSAYVNVPTPPKAPHNGLPSASASSRRKEAVKRNGADAVDSSTCPAPRGAPSERRSQRGSATAPSSASPASRLAPGPSGPGAAGGTRSLPSSLPLPLRAPSSEHIYETIPESDSEHIYCEPYEPTAEYTNVQPLFTLQLRKEGRQGEDRTTLRLGPAGPSARHAGSSGSSGSSGSCSTMYTNAANLQHTIEVSERERERDQTPISLLHMLMPRDGCALRLQVQQELFRQSLRQTTPTSSSRPQLPLPSPSSSGRLRSLPQPQPKPLTAPAFPFPPPPPAPSDAKMEWKVKRRADGSRYITRRPVRTRVIRETLRDRAAQLRDERAGFSTEDDTASELKMGRYWTKAERKQHVRRKRQQQLQQPEQPKPQPKQSQLNEEDAGRRPLNVVDLSHKKMTRKKSNVDDFTTVQELLAKGSTASTNAKMLGLLSVTTV
ncbi:E3 ubiquitin-protein ligase PDZRN3 [Frankliniella fusca]|uniref:E3 ubiquitin-protein ligase PDZRN3 n=1 Tax=Frankliniella fusca TaxID=407009 RepID=A0AAE1HZ48_9NEOP|nr:E3 ubiquitin-protein ligase PDZRN3 [Frankliniella fusca]